MSNILVKPIITEKSTRKSDVADTKKKVYAFRVNKEANKIEIKKAIESHFCSCSVIEVKEWEEKKEWSTFFKLHKPKLILGDPSLFSVKNLLPFYKENAVSKQMSLNTHPFMLLQPLADYLNHPEHKKSLWKNLCNSLRQP